MRNDPPIPAWVNVSIAEGVRLSRRFVADSIPPAALGLELGRDMIFRKHNQVSCGELTKYPSR